MDGHLERAVFVLKARGIGHAAELHRFVIDDRGAHVGAQFAELRGVLTGIPEPGRPARRPASPRSSKKKGRGR